MLLGELEWFEESDINKMILLKKDIINNDKIPIFIKKILTYIRSIKFDATPDYDYIIGLMI
jgi:hypothetical protein